MNSKIVFPGCLPRWGGYPPSWNLTHKLPEPILQPKGKNLCIKVA